MASLLRRSANLHSNSSLAPLVVAVLFGSLAMIAVVLRLMSRRIQKLYLVMNDYMILVALVCRLTRSKE